MNSSSNQPTKISFLKKVVNGVKWALGQLNKMIFSVNHAQAYNLNWNHILTEYRKQGVQTIEEFAVSYTYDFALNIGVMDDKKTKEAIYNDILQKLQFLKEEGKLV